MDIFQQRVINSLEITNFAPKYPQQSKGPKLLPDAKHIIKYLCQKNLLSASKMHEGQHQKNNKKTTTKTRMLEHAEHFYTLEVDGTSFRRLFPWQ